MSTIQLKHILVATDFSEPSLSAMQYAQAFAETFGAKLHVLHVLEDSLVFASASLDGSVPLPTSVREEMENVARSRMEESVATAKGGNYDVETVLVSGSPFVEIIRYARNQSMDLIVLGTHGRGPIAHMLMGSVAEKVVRKAPCPVLTVRHPEHEFIMP